MKFDWLDPGWTVDIICMGDLSPTTTLESVPTIKVHRGMVLFLSGDPSMLQELQLQGGISTRKAQAGHIPQAGRVQFRAPACGVSQWMDDPGAPYLTRTSRNTSNPCAAVRGTQR